MKRRASGKRLEYNSTIVVCRERASRTIPRGKWAIDTNARGLTTVVAWATDQQFSIKINRLHLHIEYPSDIEIDHSRAKAKLTSNDLQCHSSSLILGRGLSWYMAGAVLNGGSRRQNRKNSSYKDSVKGEYHLNCWERRELKRRSILTRVDKMQFDTTFSSQGRFPFEPVGIEMHRATSIMFSRITGIAGNP